MAGRKWRLNPAGVKFWLGVGAGALCAYLVLGVYLPQAQYRARAAQAKQNLHAVQLALERRAVDSPDSTYPRDIYDLLRGGYLSALPENPFSRRPMRCVGIDCPVRSERGWLNGPDVPVLAPGDFVYVRRYGEGYSPGQPPGDLPVTGYTLVLY